MDFVTSVFHSLEAPDTTKLLIWKGEDSGVGGRIGYWENAFRLVNGYDEDMKGNGSEDIDLKWRFKAHPLLSVGRVVVFKDGEWRRFSSGWSVCNDPGGDDVNGICDAKLTHVDPSVTQGKTWGKHSGANWNLVCQKTSPIRNQKQPFDKLGLPWALYGWAGVLSDVVLRTASERPLSWGYSSTPLRYNEATYGGLANATSGQKIKFITFGCQLAEMLWGTPDVQKLDTYLAAHRLGPMKRIALATLMMREEGLIKEDELVVQLNPRMAMKYTVTAGTRDHCGLHAEAVGEMVRHIFSEPQRLTTWMRRLSEALQHGSDVVLLVYDVRTGRSDVVLLVYDVRTGRTATAAAILMQHLLQALPIKAAVGDINHLARPLWSERLCGPCQECTSQNAKRSAYLHVFRRIWADIGPTWGGALRCMDLEKKAGV